MSSLKDQIITEVEENLGPGYVMMMQDAMEKCPTLKCLLEVGKYADFSKWNSGLNSRQWTDQRKLRLNMRDHVPNYREETKK